MTIIINKNKTNNESIVKKLKITICLCIRDREKYMTYINTMFTNIEKQYSDIDFQYYIYENNSKDKTKELIVKFFNNRKGEYYIEDVPNSKIKGGINIDRGKMMCRIRNKLKRLHKKLDSDYTLLLDSDVVFTFDTVSKLITTIEDNIKDNIVMSTPFCLCYKTYKIHNITHYYDSFAFISNKGLSYKDTQNTCLFDSCKLCKYLRKRRGIYINDKILYNDKQLIYAKSCFGSMALIKTDVYNNVDWNETICEHHSFCDNISKYGKIVVNPSIKIFTSQPELNNYNQIQMQLNFIINKDKDKSS